VAEWAGHFGEAVSCFSAVTTLRPRFGQQTRMRYRVTPHRLLTRNPSLRHCTRTVYDVVHGTPSQRSPLCSGSALRTIKAAQLHTKLLAQRGCAGWMLRLHEYRQEDGPAEQWRIDHEQAEPIVWMQQF
jgi:hypothetical protein